MLPAVEMKIDDEGQMVRGAFGQPAPHDRAHAARESPPRIKALSSEPIARYDGNVRNREIGAVNW